ncbi:MAG: sodium pump decarboxylase gamma subunit [Candidatus Avilachnospira sp.]|jgi:hypothetical protein
MEQNLITALNMMWQGMLGLFVVMGLIAVIVFIMIKTDK